MGSRNLKLFSLMVFVLIVFFHSGELLIGIGIVVALTIVAILLAKNGWHIKWW